jgi:hypothetical protein
MIPLPTIDMLDSITIPVACPVPWDQMRGDHRTRFCDKCSQNVYDVSELTAKEAVALVTRGETIPCLRLYRRQDGRVMTADCATKRERVWKWLHKRSTWAAAVFSLVFLGCEKPIGVTAGVPCVDPSLNATYKAAGEQISEHAARTISASDHTTSASRLDADAKAEAPIRHETTGSH